MNEEELGIQNMLNGLQWSPEFWGGELEAVNQMMQQSIGVGMNEGVQILWYLGLWLNIVTLIVFITTAIGLYKLSKKLGDDHSWLAFVPLVQLYTFIKTAGYSFWKGILLLIAYGILAWIIAATIFIGSWMLTSTLPIGNSIIWLIVVAMVMGVVVSLIAILIATFFLYAGMARRAWKSTGTAILMALFPWCMLWIVSNKIQSPKNKNQTGNSWNEKIEL